MSKTLAPSQKIEKCTDKFRDEEVESNYTYPPEYKGPKSIEEQILVIAKVCDLDPTSALEYAKRLPALESFVPADALPWTGWFAKPAVYALARKHFPEVIKPAEKECRAIQFIFGKLAASRRFYNYREDQITPERWRMNIRTADALSRVAEMQGGGDILIVTAQLGMRHRGRSTRRAREVFASNEYGHGSLTGGSILLTHPEREVRWEQLHMDLPGDESSPNADGQFVLAPSFLFIDDRLEFSTGGFGLASGLCGSASGFLPQ
jgi:hypothetical protein